MKKKLTLFTILITLIPLLLMFGLGLLVTRNNNYDQAREAVTTLTKVYAAHYADDPLYVVEVSADVRVTVIAPDGTVLADSKHNDVSDLENHLAREEVAAAFSGTPKTVVRHSATLDVDLIYYAEKVSTANSFVIVRVGKTVESVQTYFVKTIPLMLAVMLGSIVLSAIFGLLIGDRTLRPLKLVKESLNSVNEGTYKTTMPTTKDDDVNKILVEINEIGNKLQSNIATLSAEQEKLDGILNNVADAIIVIDAQGNLQLLNKAAARLFAKNNEILGTNYLSLTSNEILTTRIGECIFKKCGAIFDFSYRKSYFVCNASATEKGNLIIVLTDITAAKASEKMRGEFFVNASHELKTPLTSIKGFNELLSLQNKNPDLDKYVAQIAKESDRMLLVIEEMLKINHLETKREIEAVTVDLIEVAKDVAQSLAPICAQKHVTMAVAGQGSVEAEHNHMYELIKNLTENAVKYNNDGGSVEVIVTETKSLCTLTVKDNGIGIDRKHQSRIFERFYRVEKSRSRETGGTGLGLSIVKHVADLYHAELSLTSKVGVGTTIEIEFRK